MKKMRLKYYLTFDYSKIKQLQKLDKVLEKEVLNYTDNEDFDIEIISKGIPCEILAFPIKIDTLIKELQELKSQGMNYVSIGDDDDLEYLNGYRLQGVKITESETKEIEDYLNPVNPQNI